MQCLHLQIRLICHISESQIQVIFNSGEHKWNWGTFGKYADYAKSWIEAVYVQRDLIKSEK